MKKIITDCVSTNSETSGLIKNSATIELLNEEKICRIFASDTSLYIFTEQQINNADKTYYIIENGKRSIPFDEITDYRLSINNKVMLYNYRLGNEWFISYKENVKGPFDKVKNCNYSADGILNYFIGEINQVSHLISRHKILERVDDTLKTFFPYQSESSVYSCVNVTINDKQLTYVITEKSTYGPYLKASILHYNNNKSDAAVINDKSKNEYFLLYDDIIEGPFLYDKSNFLSIGPSVSSDLFVYNSPASSEDKSSSFQFTALTDKGYYIYNGHEKTGPFEEIISISFSISGKSSYAEIKKFNSDDEKSEGNITNISTVRNHKFKNTNESYRSIWVLIGDDEFGPYDNVSGPFRNTTDGDICFFGTRDDVTYLYDFSGIIAGPYSNVEPLYFYRGLQLSSYHVEIDGKWYYVRNNELTGPFDSIGSLPHYDRNTGIDIFTAETDGLRYIIIGDKKYGPYDEIAAIGRNLYNETYRYIVKIKKSWYLFKEDITIKIDVIPGDMIFNCKDTVINISPFNSKQPQEKLFYIINGAELEGPFGPYGTIYEHKNNEGIITGYNTLSYDPTSKRSTYSMITGGKEFGPYDNSPYCGSLKDGSIIARIYLNDNLFLLAGDKKYGPYQQINKIVFNKSNEKFACSVIQNDSHFIFCDGIEYGPFQNTMIAMLMPATDEFLFTYSIGNKVESIFLNDRSYGPFGRIPESDIIQGSDGKMISFSSWENNKLNNYIISNTEVIQGILTKDGEIAYILNELEESGDHKN